jgi:hypothetical protein
MSRKFNDFLLSLLIVFTAPGCQTNQFGEEARVKKVVYEIIEADNQSDLPKVLSFYDSTASLMPPGKPVIQGKTAIRNNYQDLFSYNRLQLKTEIEEVRICDNQAWIAGYNSGHSISLITNIPITIRSKFIMLLQKHDSDQ